MAITWCFAMDHIQGEDFTIERPEQYEFFRDTFPHTGRIRSSPSSRSTTTRWDRGSTRSCLSSPDGPLWAVAVDASTDDRQDELRRGDVRERHPPRQLDTERLLLGSDHRRLRTRSASATSRERASSASRSSYWLQTEAPRVDGGHGFPGLRMRRDVVGTTDGLAMYPYIREARRIRAGVTMLEQHISAETRQDGAQRYDDAVGIGYYFLDMHQRTEAAVPFLTQVWPYQIPLGSLTPERIRNVIPACKNLGVTHVVNSATRLHPVEWVIGEAAGTSLRSARSKDGAVAVRADSAASVELQSVLARDGVELEWPRLTTGAGSGTSTFIHRRSGRRPSSMNDPLRLGRHWCRRDLSPRDPAAPNSGGRRAGAVEASATPSSLERERQQSNTESTPSIATSTSSSPTTIDAVTVASPIGLHFDHCRRALEAGKHVHANKTMCTTVDEADELIGLAATNGLRLVASPGEVLRPQLRRTRELIEEGAIGELSWVICGGAFESYHEQDEPERLDAPGGGAINPTWYFRKPGGGPMYDITVYSLHQLTSVLGPARRVTAMSGVRVAEREFLGDRIATEADDNTILLVDFGDSRYGVVHGTAAGAISDQFGAGRYFGTRGTIDGVLLNGEPFEFEGRAETTDAPVTDWEAQMRVLPHVTGRHRTIPESHVFEDIMQLVELVRRDTPTPVTAEHARHVIEIIEAGYRAAASGEAQELRTSVRARATRSGGSMTRAFSEPTSVRRSDGERFLWGDEGSGQIADVIYGRGDRISAVTFTLGPGHWFGASDDWKPMYDQHRFYYVVSGALAIHDPETERWQSRTRARQLRGAARGITSATTRATARCSCSTGSRRATAMSTFPRLK